MARILVGACFGLIVGTTLGAAFGVHADPAGDDVAQAASLAGVSPADLRGAMTATDDGDPVHYLRAVGELPPTPALSGPATSARPPNPPNPPPVARATAPAGSVWDALAQCESSGNWSAATGNGYGGGLQFDQPTWRAYGGTGLPQNASRAQQIAVAQRLAAARGFAPWPACSRRLGLR